MKRFVVAGSLLVVPLLVGCGSPTEVPPGANARVDRVVDGDTIDVDVHTDGRVTRERVRLIGIDTPETKKPDTPVECFGPEASRRTESLLPPDTWVTLTVDRETRDPYGRLLAYVHRWSDGLFVNLALVADGYASTLRIEPNTARAEEFQRAEASARTRRLGQWGACFTADR